MYVVCTLTEWHPAGPRGPGGHSAQLASYLSRPLGSQGADTPVPVPVPVPDLSGDGDGGTLPRPRFPSGGPRRRALPQAGAC